MRRVRGAPEARQAGGQAGRWAGALWPLQANILGHHVHSGRRAERGARRRAKRLLAAAAFAPLPRQFAPRHTGRRAGRRVRRRLSPCRNSHPAALPHCPTAASPHRPIAGPQRCLFRAATSEGSLTRCAPFTSPRPTPPCPAPPRHATPCPESPRADTTPSCSVPRTRRWTPPSARSRPPTSRRASPPPPRCAPRRTRRRTSTRCLASSSPPPSTATTWCGRRSTACWARVTSPCSSTCR